MEYIKMSQLLEELLKNPIMEDKVIALESYLSSVRQEVRSLNNLVDESRARLDKIQICYR